ncbi:MAG: DUF2914 domain-containing protein [Acidobacteria bacterium]|nr:DUF2914 domain-containing protein [Acidobacteriota bacterium]
MLGEQIAHARAKVMRRRERARQWYKRYEKYYPLIAFIIGFAYDSLTLTRIDRLLDNVILLGYTLAAGLLIALLGRIEQGRMSHPWLTRRLNWITSATHFFLGGLLSSYVVFYFKSAAVGKAFIFVGLLVGLMLANEFFSHRLRNLKYLCAIYYFCCFAFLTFFLPVMTHVMGDAMFIASGLLSFVLTGGVVALIYGARFQSHQRDILSLARLPVIIFVTLAVFYFQNWMPPVPLALKEGGIYRSVKRVGDKYEVRYREPSWWQWWKRDEREFEYAPGDTVYCFAAVFSPAGLNERVIHEWQQQNADGDWITRDRLSYPIIGGRDGGYRGYTLKKRIAPGQWRVEVKTVEGRLLGRVPFEVVAVPQSPQPIKIAYR